MHGWGFYGGWFWVFAIIRWVVLAAIVAGAVWYFTGHRRQGGSDALAILQRRLAAGEIGEEEYTRLKDLLSK